MASYPANHSNHFKTYSHEIKCDQVLVTGRYGEIVSPLSTGNTINEIDEIKENYYFVAQRFLSEEKKKYNIFEYIEKINLIVTGLSTINIFITNNISNIYFEFTLDKSILFIGDLSGYKLYLEIFFNEETLNSLQVEDTVLNIYKNQTNVFCKAGEISEIYRHIKEFTVNIQRKSSEDRDFNGLEYLSNIFTPTRSLQENFVSA